MSNTRRPTLGVMGGGPWGVALALAASRAGAEVALHTRRSDVPSAEHLTTTTSLAEVAEARLIVIAVPSTVVREVARSLGDHLDGQHLVVHGIRGLSVDELGTVSDVLREETPARRVGALGGPVQASELLDGRPSAMVIGSQYPEVVAATSRAFQHGALRVYGTTDLRGLEWASALVGCLSVGVGYADQAGAGPGLLAALISRAVDEAARVAAAAGADEKTMYGLGGYGDLLASLRLSDRPEVVVGRALARGKSLGEACSEAKLRVEAIALIPRIARFAREARLRAPTFDALVAILEGTHGSTLIDMMFTA